MYLTSWNTAAETISNDTSRKIQRLEVLKKYLNKQRPLSPELAKKLQEKILLDFTYHSNAIEGNTLSLMETKIVLFDGITIGGKTVREHVEAINHLNAFSWLLEQAKNPEIATIDEIKYLHSLVLCGLECAGQWRTVQVYILGAEHTPPPPERLMICLNEMTAWIENQAYELHPIERAARLHADLATIHPFTDGNGRTSRLLMNLELLKNGYPVALIKKEQRPEYFNHLIKIQSEGEFNGFIDFICRAIEEGFKPYWTILNIDPNDIPADQETPA